MALSNCNQPEREADFRRWYIDVHLDEVVETGACDHPALYVNAKEEAGPGEARYCALYESEWEDQAEAYKVIMDNAARLVKEGLMHPAIAFVTGGQYRRTGPEFQTGRTGRPATGLLLTLGDSASPSEQAGLDTYYNDTFIPEVLRAGIYHTAYRYELVVPPDRFQYLTLYETDQDPLEASREFPQMEVQLKTHAAEGNLLVEKLRGAYTRV